ncbi:3-keto-disaccharide hydrolase [Agaribacter marinus]|uniref:3-keto-disaccharide hydrolase n=1 Tax=Agaribacter marinus TaxID=1431249 RepID=UPI0024E12055|nr:DUF1080 domain-containing protein [Agaribacter marinus]
MGLAKNSNTNKLKWVPKTLLCVSGSTFLVVTSTLSAAFAVDEYNPKDTEVWTPTPKEVKPYPFPSDAIVLFDGNNLDQWHGHKGPADWDVHNGITTIKPGATGIATKEKFCDMQLHIEWRTPEKDPERSGQRQGNSGIYIQGKYELQVLDSYQNPTYVNGQAGSIYKQSIPLVNASLPPMQWQTYDVIYKAPRFSDSGELLEKANITVLHNGIVVQNNVEIQGRTQHKGPPYYEAHGCESIYIQNKNIKVSYRNIWARHL